MIAWRPLLNVACFCQDQPQYVPGVLRPLALPVSDEGVTVAGENLLDNKVRLKIFRAYWGILPQIIAAGERLSTFTIIKKSAPDMPVELGTEIFSKQIRRFS